jgi:prefoldin subunit 5
MEERTKRFNMYIFKNKKEALKQIKPQIDDISYLMEDLDIYLDRKERRVRRLLKVKNFFKPRRIHRF